MSVSLPFFTLSAQPEAMHTLLVHTLLAQSSGWEHVLPSAHFTGQPPPQSRSVSVPFFTPSLHAGV
jgi:hypothetical protein